MADILILGYGNTLRSDDALGVYAAHALQDFYCDDAGMRVLATAQLSLDLAEDVSQAEFVLFIDATEGGPPGEIFREALTPADDNIRFSHHCTPCSLLMAAMRLYGRSPLAISLTMAGASSGVGLGLTHEIQGRLPYLLEHAKSIVSQWRLDATTNNHQTRDAMSHQRELLPR
jgi:hydrogenase maturation protease